MVIQQHQLHCKQNDRGQSNALHVTERLLSIATQVNRACSTACSSCDDYYAAMKCGEIRILQ